jgi:RNA polymerase sigma-70 factor (ECF subfamily)
MDDKRGEELQLIAQAMESQEGAFEKLYKMKIKDILYISMKFMKNNLYDAEDVLQEVMVKVYMNITSLKSPEAFDKWLYKIVINTCYGMYRKDKSRKEDVPVDLYTDQLKEERVEFLPQNYIENKEKQQIVLDLVEELPKRRKECILLYYYNNLSHEEISSVLDISRHTVDQHLKRARMSIRRKLGESGKKTSASIYSVTGVPVLAYILNQEANKLITSEMQSYVANGLEMMFQSVQNSTLVSASKAAGMSKTTSAAKAAGKGILKKTSVGLITVASTVAVGIGIYNLSQSPNNDVMIETQAIESAAVVESEADLETEEDVLETPKETEFYIETVADMITPEKEEILTGYVQGNIDSQEEFNMFINDIGAELSQSAYVDEDEYTLYTLEKQDKRLLILEYRNSSQGMIEIQFDFTYLSEEVPYNSELIYFYELWKNRQY